MHLPSNRGDEASETWGQGGPRTELPGLVMYRHPSVKVTAYLS